VGYLTARMNKTELEQQRSDIARKIRIETLKKLPHCPTCKRLLAPARKNAVEYEPSCFLVEGKEVLIEDGSEQ